MATIFNSTGAAVPKPDEIFDPVGVAST